MRLLTAAAGRSDYFVETLNGMGPVLDHHAPPTDNPEPQVTRITSDWSRDPRHDDRMTRALGLVECPSPDSCPMGDRPHTHQGQPAPDEQVAKIGYTLNREYLDAERKHRGIAQHVQGPSPEWMMVNPRQQDQAELVQMGRSLLPSESGRPAGSAVTTAPLAMPTEGRCEAGHVMEDPEATACGICLAGRLNEDPDSPVPPSPLPAALDSAGRSDASAVSW